MSLYGRNKRINLSPLFKKSGSVFILRITGMVLTYVGILFITNVYGAEVYGRFSLVQTLLQLIILLFSMGLGTAIIKLTSDQNFFSGTRPINTYLKNAIGLILISSMVCSALLVVLKSVLAVKIFNDPGLIPYLKYLSYFVFFGIYHAFIMGFIQAKGKFVKFGLNMYVTPYLLFLGALIAGTFFKHSEELIIFFFILSFTVVSLFMTTEIPWRSLNVRKKIPLKNLLDLSIPMMFSAAFIFIANWTDVFMLGAMVNKTDLGVYNAAYKLAIIAVVVINAVNTVLGPKISQLYGQNNIDQIKVEVKQATKLITYLTIPIVLVLILYRKPLLGFFGPEFIAAESALVIISMGLLFNALSGSVGQVLNMTNHQKALRNITIIGASSNVLLNYVLIKKMGIEGAAIASLITNVLINIICLIYIKIKFNFFAFFNP
ncbi:MAG: flippase [Flavobacteriaceae bacterium]|nr:flippase [Bacteroidia bacterium]MBT8286652.1 flippase [Bacteroidia bacterium]NNF75177.1 flippase [Flavobacteriaceae bacterium]NNK72450.1 flippase [Flavobacteriaceae bacterium]